MTIFFQGKRCSSKWVLLLYIDKRFDHELKTKLNIYEQWVGHMLQIVGSRIAVS